MSLASGYLRTLSRIAHSEGWQKGLFAGNVIYCATWDVKDDLSVVGFLLYHEGQGRVNL